MPRCTQWERYCVMAVRSREPTCPIASGGAPSGIWGNRAHDRFGYNAAQNPGGKNRRWVMHQRARFGQPRPPRTCCCSPGQPLQRNVSVARTFLPSLWTFASRRVTANPSCKNRDQPQHHTGVFDNLHIPAAHWLAKRAVVSGTFSTA